MWLYSGYGCRASGIPVNLALGTGRAAAARGWIYERSAVHQIARTCHVQTGGGRYGDHVILAANGYLAELNPRLRPCDAIKNFIVATNPGRCTK